MKRRIVAVLTGLASVACGLVAGISLNGGSALPESRAACPLAMPMRDDTILCKDTERAPSTFAQPADEALRAQLNEAMLALEREGRLAPFTAVQQIDAALIPDLPEPHAADEARDSTDLYQQLAAATVMIHTGYKCDRCANWHGGVASGFIIHPDGWVITAAHALRNLEANRHLSVMLHDRTLHSIAGVALIDDDADIAVIWIEALNLPFLPLAADAPSPGAPVSVLSHPNGHFYVLTRGVVSRLLDNTAQPRQRLQITAPFAIGSSGAPVIDDAGNVVGLALSTETIYADPEHQKNPQLVIPTCTPAEEIRAVIERN